MADPVIHLSPELHARLKARCKADGVSIREFAASAIERALGAGVPVARKGLQRTSDASDAEIWRRPPFWAGRDVGGRRG